MTTNNRLTDEQLQAIREGCNGVTPGPWCDSGPHRKEGYFSISTSKSLDGSARILADVYAWEAEVQQNAAHIASLDPETVRALVTELIERRAGDSAIVEACAKTGDAVEFVAWLSGFLGTGPGVPITDENLAYIRSKLAKLVRQLGIVKSCEENDREFETVGIDAMNARQMFDRLMSIINYDPSAGASITLGELDCALAPPAPAVTLTQEQIAEALGRITDLSTALRSGGPDVTDLEGLSDALSEAVEIASDLRDRLATQRGVTK